MCVCLCKVKCSNVVLVCHAPGSIRHCHQFNAFPCTNISSLFTHSRDGFAIHCTILTKISTKWSKFDNFILSLNNEKKNRIAYNKTYFILLYHHQQRNGRNMMRAPGKLVSKSSQLTTMLSCNTFMRLYCCRKKRENVECVQLG